MHRNYSDGKGAFLMTETAKAKTQKQDSATSNIMLLECVQAKGNGVISQDRDHMKRSPS